MAINFTDSPADGATQVISGRTYTYNSAKNKWDTTATEVVGPTAKTYATVNDLPGTALTGDQAFVSGTNRLYIWNGSGWYNIALVNSTPTWNTQPASSYDLATDGTATTITIVATDPEGLPITYSIASDTSGNIATVTQNANVFTVTPSTNTANAGTFSLTFRASDGVNIASAISEFTLQFSVQNSNYTTALITSVGTNNQVNNTFVDSSTNSHTITAYGNVTQNTFSPYRHRGYSTYFDGSDSLLLPSTSTLSFGSGDFCIEFFVNPSSSTAQQGLISNAVSSSGGDTTFEIQINASGLLLFLGWNTVFLTSSTTISANSWNHVVVCRNGTTASMFLNGTRVATNTVSQNFSSTNAVYIGRQAASSSATYLTGYMTDVRVVKGSNVYDPTQTILTVPDQRLTAITNTSLLTCHLPYIADGSTNDHTITVNGNTKTEPFGPYDHNGYSASNNGGSIYFDGNGDYLRADTALDASTSAGDPMTVETWFNVPSSATLGSSSSFNAIWGFNAASNGSNVATFGVTDTGFYWHRNTSGITLSNSWGRDQWHHLAVVYHDGTNGTAVYLNGESIYTNATAHTTAFADCVCGIGVEFDAGSGGTPGNYFPGHLADFRITHSAVYTSNFTPPASPLTEITNTALLLRGTNAGIIDKSQSVKTLTLNGDVKSSTTQTKYLTSSMYFDGTGDYITLSTLDHLDWLTNLSSVGTIEAWVYYTNSRNGGQVYQHPSIIAIGSTYFTLNLDSAGTLRFYWYNGSLNSIASTSPVVSANTWAHVAAVITNTSGSNNLTLYVNGSAVGTGTYGGMGAQASGALDSSTYIGWGNAADSNSYWPGYISDLRITKGLARYTANFTPPTTALKG